MITNPVHITVGTSAEDMYDRAHDTVSEAVEYGTRIEASGDDIALVQANTRRGEISALVLLRVCAATEPDAWPGARYEADVVRHTWHQIRPAFTSFWTVRHVKRIASEVRG